MNVPQQLREQPAILEPRIVEVIAVTKLQHQQVVRPLRVVHGESRGFLNGHNFVS
jgi:hypothetical protein